MQRDDIKVKEDFDKQLYTELESKPNYPFNYSECDIETLEIKNKNTIQTHSNIKNEIQSRLGRGSTLS